MSNIMWKSAGRVVLAAFAATVLSPGVLSAQDADKVKRGEAVYAEQKCSLCHSIAGKGNAKGSLDGVGKKLSGRGDQAVDRQPEGDDHEDQVGAETSDEGVPEPAGRRRRRPRRVPPDAQVTSQGLSFEPGRPWAG